MLLKFIFFIIGYHILIFPVTLPELFKKLPYVVVGGADNPLDHMKRIDDRNCVGKVLFHICNVRVVHIGNKVFYLASFFFGNGNEIRFCYRCSSAPKQINRVSGIEILNDQYIFTVIVHIQMHFINGNGICKGKPVKLDIAVKNLVHIRIRHMESFSNRCGCF